MGQSIVVTEKPSSNRGVVRFETNRALTGMGHERYLRGADVWGNRPPDELARRLFAQESVAGVQINGNIITVDLVKGYAADGLKDVIENLYRFYPDAPAGPEDEAEVVEATPAEVAPADEPAADEPVAVAEAAPETAPEHEAEVEAPADPEAEVEAEPAVAEEPTPVLADPTDSEPEAAQPEAEAAEPASE